MFKRKLPRFTPFIIWSIFGISFIFNIGNLGAKIYNLFAEDKNQLENKKTSIKSANEITAHPSLIRSKKEKYLIFYLQKDDEKPQLLVKLNNKEVPDNMSMVITLNSNTRLLKSIGVIIFKKHSIEGENFSQQLWDKFQERPKFKLAIKGFSKVKPNEVVLQTVKEEDQPQYKIFYNVGND